MRCDQAQKLMDMYAGEEIPLAFRVAFETHLHTCPICRRKQVELDKLLAILRSLPKLPPVPKGFINRVMAQARAQSRSPQPALGGRLRLRLREWWEFVCAPRTAGAVAAVATGLLLGVLMGQQAVRGLQNAGAEQPRTVDTYLLGGHELDLLSGSPGGSFTDAYLSLTSRSEGWET